MSFTPRLRFGPLLKQLRKQAGMTQRDLAAALGYSDSLISNLEKEQRLPDLQAVMQWFIPALGLQDDPQTAAQLIEQAAIARGERPPASVTLQRTARVVFQEELDPHPAHLPSPPTALIGRTVEVNQLGNRLLGHSGRLLTLLGPPGIGKTRLALALATQLHDHYRDGAAFVPLAAVNNAPLMASTILDALGGGVTSPKPPASQLIEHLQRKNILVVLDNCEQIVDAAPFVAKVLAECAGVTILATSRERLHLRAEQRYRVPPLTLGAAVDLFTQRAAAVDHDFVLTAANRPLIEAICQRLDRLPLAIELCAAQVDLLSLTHLLSHLQTSPLDLLVEGAQDLPPQHRTLRTAIGRSYALLNDEERILFRSLGIFLGGFDLAALAAIVEGNAETRTWRLNDDALPQALVSTLRALVVKSLVQVETLPTSEQRFLLLDTLREFALEQVRAHGEEVELRQRHYLTYLHRFRTSDSYLRGPEATAWFARLEPEQDNLHAAMQWLLDEKRYEDAAWLLLAATWFWRLYGHWYQLGRWLAQLLPYRQALLPNVRLAILIILYAHASALEEFRPIDRCTGEVMQLLESDTDTLLQAHAWYWLAVYAADVAQADAAWEQSIASARAASGSPGLGTEFCVFTDRDFILISALWGYTTFLIEQGEVARAAPIAAESLKRFQAWGDRYQISNGLGNLGLLTLLQGDLAGAHTLLHEAVTHATTFRHQEILVGRWQPLLGLVTLYSGDVPEARRLLNESLRLCLELKDNNFLARNYTCLAETALWAGEVDQAAHWLAQSLAYHAVPRWITVYEVERFFVAARLATAQQQYQRAATLFGLAEQAHSHIHHAVAGPMRTLADAALTTVQVALDSAVFAEAFAAGQQLSLEEAFATILAPSQVAG